MATLRICVFLFFLSFLSGDMAAQEKREGRREGRTVKECRISKELASVREGGEESGCPAASKSPSGVSSVRRHKAQILSTHHI